FPIELEKSGKKWTSVGVLPVAEYSHATDGICVIGCGVYRGPESSLDGVYFVGDWGTGRFWGLKKNDGGKWQLQQLLHSKLKFTGKQPERKPLGNITGIAYCSEHCNGQPPLDEKWVFGKNGSDDTFANVLVYVAKGLEGKKFTPPKSPTILDQVGCVYTPRVV